MTNGHAKGIDKSPYIIIVGAGYAYRIIFDSRNCCRTASLSLGQQSRRDFSCYSAQVPTQS